MNPRQRFRAVTAVLICAATMTSGCGWQGLNSLALPGTAGNGPGAYEVKAEIPDITNIERNSRVRVGDVTVGNVTDIDLRGWHALVTMKVDSDVVLPANATATVGQTSLLGSLHIELAAPKDAEPQGRLTNGALISLASTGSYPTTEQTLAAVSFLLNGGGLGQIGDITESLTTALGDNRDQDLRQLVEHLATFTARLNEQTQDIIGAAESLNNLSGQLAAQRPVIDEALHTIPRAAAVLADERDNLVETLAKTGQLAALTNATVGPTKDALVQQLNDLGPVLESLANAGPALTRALSLLGTFPFPMEKIRHSIRGDYNNLTLVFDLTLSRIDGALLTGTRFEGSLTELELQWGRTIGQTPSPYTAGNPLIVPYNSNQGS
ncbi:MCE family protein [[Mycobacterium] burgundiense]|uniref:MCE family protein n=1 Tax=[Mycobacterium] burgundiense TaxID=3064286 RepID=A0ABM9LB90_9MYCO|nr:MCE family protein [Mycolicibacterium sp. MU0053]CAJ1496063.1 MCE family protein [Mycolicibacterium sp. MU0053]